MSSYMTSQVNSSARDKSASLGTQKVRVGVIGCGGWGRNLVRNFSEIGALAAIVEPNADAAEALARKYNSRVRDLASVLADPRIDAVVIAAPAALHYELANRALQAGKHCFVEKPLALELAQAHELCALVELLDRRLMVG